ncbi:MAG: glycerol-3-phosphate dehydrogenase [Sphingomonadales bacterium]|nr:glycerol-3-phosphate dehydrogenase [Sphingomonadaceae bacterium]MBS3932097.1 glycerol-3-phosphate dehydrogenase [Sphingomonadales bacterium]
MSDLFDLAVIGGGINGAGIARDAAGRGAKVLLLEAGDLAQGTSSASTKLIHGGLRYLEHYEFSLVRESLKEREALWAIAPHIIHPMRFVLPYVEGLRPRWLLRLGLFLYDHIGGRKKLPATRSVDLRSHPAGKPLKGGFGAAFEYSDGWVDDARLVVLNAMDAAEKGALVCTRTRVEGATRGTEGWVISTTNGTYHAHALVNAAGPGVLAVESTLGEAPDYAMRLVRGSHVVVPKLFDHPYSYFFQLPDGRIFFAIPYQRDFTLIGTTDRDQQPGDPIKASEEEIAYLCEGASRYFAKAITPADVVWTYSGVRPLIDDGSGKPEAATRGYRLELSEAGEGAPLLSVYGGKITTYRHLAEEAVDLLAGRLPALSGKAWTTQQPLPGGDFPVEGLDALKAALASDYSFLGEADVDRIARAYGTRARAWLGDAQGWQALGRLFGAGLTQAEVDYLGANEWAVGADDVLWRRTKLGLRLDAEQRAALAEYLGS